MNKILSFLACLAMGNCTLMAAFPDPAFELTEYTVQAKDNTCQNKHLKFAGIPIDGTLQEFGEQMKKKQYKLLYEDKELSIYRGPHAGRKNCLIYVYAHPENGNVYMVGVNFGAQKDWDKLKYRYLQLKSRMTEIFGEPVLCTEVFHTSESPKTKEQKMECVRQDLVEYVSGFRTSNGLISVKMVHSPRVDKETATVMLYYTDRVNCVDKW